MSNNRQGWLILGGIGAGAGLLAAALVAVNDSQSEETAGEAESVAAEVVSTPTTEAAEPADAGWSSAQESVQEAERRERERRALAAVNRAREASGSANLYQFIHQAAKQAQESESGVIEISNRGARVSRRLIPQEAFEQRRNAAYGIVDEPEPDDESPSGGRSLADVLAEAQRELERRRAAGSQRVQALEPAPKPPPKRAAATASDEE